MAALRIWQGRYPEAVSAARAGLAAPASKDPRVAMLTEAVLQDAVGEGAYYASGARSAVAPYRAAMALLEEASRRWPDDPIIRRQLPRSRWALGTTLIEAGGVAEAAAILRRGAEEAQAVVA